jgi:hypothetical protein
VSSISGASRLLDANPATLPQVRGGGFPSVGGRVMAADTQRAFTRKLTIMDSTPKVVDFRVLIAPEPFGTSTRHLERRDGGAIRGVDRASCHA